MQKLARYRLCAGQLLSSLSSSQEVSGEHRSIGFKAYAKCWEYDGGQEPANGLTQTVKPSVTIPCGDNVTQRVRC